MQMDMENVIDPEVVAHMRTFSIVSVLRRSWRALKANPLLYFWLASITSLLSIAFFSQVPAGRFMVAMRGGRGLVYSFIFSSLLTLPTQGAVAYAVYRSETGQRATFGSSVMRAFRYLPSLAGIELLKLGFMILMLILYAVTMSTVPIRLLRMLILICLLLLFFAILTKWSVAIPAAVVEGCGPIRGINRSFRLVRGCVFKVFIFAVLMQVLNETSANGVAKFVTYFAFGAPVTPAIPGSALAVSLEAIRLVIGAALYLELREAKGAEEELEAG